jgi:hypothetical protein
MFNISISNGYPVSFNLVSMNFLGSLIMKKQYRFYIFNIFWKIKIIICEYSLYFHLCVIYLFHVYIIFDYIIKKTIE